MNTIPTINEKIISQISEITEIKSEAPAEWIVLYRDTEDMYSTIPCHGQLFYNREEAEVAYCTACDDLIEVLKQGGTHVKMPFFNPRGDSHSAQYNLVELLKDLDVIKAFPEDRRDR